MVRQSGVMSIRSLNKWLGLKTDDFTLVTFEDQGPDLDPKIHRLATGTWEHCQAVMNGLSPKGTVAEWVSGFDLLMMQDLKNRLSFKV